MAVGEDWFMQSSFPGILLKELIIRVDSRSMVTVENNWDVCYRIRQTSGLVTINNASENSSEDSMK